MHWFWAKGCTHFFPLAIGEEGIKPKYQDEMILFYSRFLQDTVLEMVGVGEA